MQAVEWALQYSLNERSNMVEEKIISNCSNTIGRNIREIRKSKNMRMQEMVIRLQLNAVEISREALVKIEGGRQHIKLS